MQCLPLCRLGLGRSAYLLTRMPTKTSALTEDEIPGEEQDADGDSHVSQVEDRPYLQVDEIHDMPQAQSVNQIADRASELEGERSPDQRVERSAFPADDDDPRHNQH